MKLFTGWVLATGLVLSAAAAHAQVVAPVSDVGSPVQGSPGLGGPYAAMPPDAPRPGYGYGPTLLPSTEVYTVVGGSTTIQGGQAIALNGGADPGCAG